MLCCPSGTSGPKRGARPPLAALCSTTRRIEPFCDIRPLHAANCRSCANRRFYHPELPRDTIARQTCRLPRCKLFTGNVAYENLDSVFYVDAKETWRTNAGGVCRVPVYILLSDEIGTWGGDIAKANLPDTFLVDYVRVYDLVKNK